MKLQAIRRLVRQLYDSAEDCAFAAQLVRKIYAPHSPGDSPSLTEERYAVRLIQSKSLSGRSLREAGPVLEKGQQIGLVESADITPAPDDLLELGEDVWVISLARPLDLGAGILFEVWYS